MPEAFSSVADMRIVIDSSTEKLDAGLTAAKNLVTRFASESNDGLSLMDRALGKTGDSAGSFGRVLKDVFEGVIGKGAADGVEALATKLTGLLGKLNEFTAFLQLAAGGANALGGIIAQQTGTKDEWGEVQKSAQDLEDTLTGSLFIAFDETKEKALGAASGLLGFENSAELSATTTNHTADVFRGLKGALDALKYGFENTFIPEKYQSLGTLEENVKKAKDSLVALQNQFAALQSMNIDMPGTVDESSLDALKQTIAYYQMRIFLLNQMAGGERMLRDVKADAAVEQSKGIEGLRAETEAMELNVETMKMSTAERQIYLAVRKAEAALDDEDSLDDDAKQRVLDKYQDRMQDAAEAMDNFTAAKKKDADTKQFLDQMTQETDGLRDRVAILGMSTAAAAAYTEALRNARAVDKLGILDPDQQATLETQMTQQLQLRLQLMADEDQNQRKRAADRDNSNFEQTIAGLQRQTAQIVARTAAMYDGSEAGRVEAIVEQQLVNLQARHIELSPQRIAAIRAQAQAQVEATLAQEEAQRQTKLVGDIGNAVTSNLDNAFRNFTRTGKFSFHDMTLSIIQDLEQIALKAAVITPLTNLLTGGTNSGGGLLVSLAGMFSSSGSSSSGWSTSVIPAFADGGDFSAGPMVVGERGPELIWPKFPGTVIPNSALPNSAPQAAAPANVEVNVINNSGAQVTQERRQSGGLDIVDIVVGVVKDSIAGGKLDGALGSRFGASVTPWQR